MSDDQSEVAHPSRVPPLASDPSRSSARVKIEATSIDTGHPDRDAHLRSNDFFAMDEYPDIEFTSTSVKAQSDDTDRVTGDLTIRGVSKAITFDASATAPSSIRGATHASASPAH